MFEVLDAAIHWPTLPWTVLLGLVVLYWLTVVFGFLDLEILDGIGDALGGLGDGALEGLDGALDGLDGVEEALDSGDAADAGGSGLLHNLGLGGVPLTLSLSLIIFFGWMFSAGGWIAVGRIVAPAPWIETLAPLAVALGALVLGMVATALFLVPFRRLLEADPSTTRKDLVGHVCQVRTGHVDENFGQAIVVLDGADLLVQVRAGSPNAFRSGSSALIFRYDPRREIFEITEAGQEMTAAEALESESTS